VSVIQPRMRSRAEPARRQDTVAERRQPPATKVTRKEKPTPKIPLSEIEQELKWSSISSCKVIEISTVLKRSHLKVWPNVCPKIRVSGRRMPIKRRQLLNEKQLGKNLSEKALKTDPTTAPSGLRWNEISARWKRFFFEV